MHAKVTKNLLEAKIIKQMAKKSKKSGKKQQKPQLSLKVTKGQTEAKIIKELVKNAKIYQKPAKLLAKN